MGACNALKLFMPMLLAADTAAAMPGRNAALPFTARTAKRGGNLQWTLQLHGGARGMDTTEIAELLADPSKVAEAMEMMKDPETMAEIRELMDDPEFRGMVTESLAAGGEEGMAALREKFEGSGLTEALSSVTPPLGAALDVLKSSAEDEETLTAALKALLSIAKGVLSSLDDGDTRRLKLSHEPLQSRLLQIQGARRCLEALGYTREEEEDGETYLCLADADADGDSARLPSASMCEHHLQLLQREKKEVEQAAAVAAQHGLPFKLALELRHVRRACAGDTDLARELTKLLLENEEFRSQFCVNGGPPAAALAPVLQLLRSQEGIRGLLEYYTGGSAGAEGTRVQSVAMVSEWKEALDAAARADRTLVAFFNCPQKMASRVMAPIYSRLPQSFADIDFVRVDLLPDDGLAKQARRLLAFQLRVLRKVFDEAFVSEAACPSFLFFQECIELRSWRHLGADVNELIYRLTRVGLADEREIHDGPTPLNG